MASKSFQELLATIDKANTNISSKLGTLDTHITAIIKAGNTLLRKIKSGTLLPDQIAQIRGKLNSLRESTLANIGSKNARISEVETVFNELLGESERKNVLSTPNVATATVPNRKNLLNYGNVGDLFSSAPEAPKYNVARGTPNRNRKNLLNYGNVGDLFSSAPEAPKYNVARGTPNRTNLLNYGNVGDLFSSAPEAPKYNVARGVPNRNRKNLLNYGNVGDLFSSAPEAQPYNVARGVHNRINKEAQKRSVLSTLNTIPDSNTVINDTHVTQVKEAIEATRALLQANAKDPIHAGLLEYVNQRYSQSQNTRSFIGEMATKHKPVLKYIVSLAGDLPSFTEGIKRPIGIFPKSDIRVRIDILTSVIAMLPEENRGELKDYLNTLYEESQKQSGGRRKTGCGCGVTGGRRTRKATRRR